MVSLMRIEWIRLMKNKKNWIILGLFLAFVLALPFYHNKKNDEAVLRRDSIYESYINYAEIERALIAKEYTDTLEDFDPDTFDEVYPKENQIRQDTWTRDIVFTQKQQLAFGRGEWMEEAKVTLAKDRNMLEGLEGGLIRERNSQTHDIGTVQELDNRIRLNEYLVSHEIMPWKTEYEPAAYPVLFYLLNTVFPLALPILICLLCSDCFATEVESGSIKMWLLMPAARWKIYAAKLMANLLYVLLVLAMILGLGLAAAGLLYGLGDAGYPIRVFYEDGQANLAAGISEITDVTVDYLPISSVVSHILLSDVLFVLSLVVILVSLGSFLRESSTALTVLPLLLAIPAVLPLVVRTGGHGTLDRWVPPCYGYAYDVWIANGLGRVYEMAALELAAALLVFAATSVVMKRKDWIC